MTQRSTVDEWQASFEDLEPSLRDTTFVVVDLETTGGSARSDTILEIGAVKVRGGEVLGEFATLVDPDRPIPPQISLLTGITDVMVAGSPSERVAVPAFLDFARGSTLVAHNAPFDIGFLKASAARLDIRWTAAPVVDTVRLARSAFSRTEVPSVRLGVLAKILGARTDPNHRALADARATVDVLHALIERLGPAAATVSDLIGAQRAVDPQRRRKRHLADGLPHAPGVYLFRGADGAVLYVGTSGDLHHRVRSYFTAAEQRRRVKDMVLAADRVDHVVCATRLEAAVREQRLIAAHQPPYNKRSKRPTRNYWMTLGSSRSPRLAVHATRPTATGTDAIGPFSSRGAARIAAAALRPAESIAALRDGRIGDALAVIWQRMQRYAAAGLYDLAATVRDDLAVTARELARAERLTALASIDEIVTAAPDGTGGWEFALTRRGRLAGAAVARRGVAPMPIVESLAASCAEAGDDEYGGTAIGEETATILADIDRPGVRIVRSSSGWSWPTRGVGRWRDFVARADLARAACDFDPR